MRAGKGIRGSNRFSLFAFFRRSPEDSTGEPSEAVKLLRSKSPLDVAPGTERMEKGRQELLDRFEQVTDSAGSREARDATRPALLRSRVISRAPLAAAAAVAVVLVVSLIFLVGPSTETTTRRLAGLTVARGEVAIESPNGNRSVTGERGEVLSGDRVETLDDSWAEITLPGGAAIRLDANSIVALDTTDGGQVSFTHITGSSYHQRPKGNSYEISCSDLAITGGSCLSLEKHGNELVIKALEGDLGVRSEDQFVYIAESNEARGTCRAGNVALEVRGILLSSLQHDWYGWNLEEDGRLGRGSGILAQALQPAPEEPPSPLEMTAAAPSEPRPEASQRSSTTPAPRAAASVLPESVQLGYYERSGEGVTLKWEAAPEGSSCDGAVILRSEVGIQPEYPRDQITGVLGDGQFLDTTVEGERSYAYRVAMVEDGTPVAYSDTLLAEVEAEVTPTLSGTCGDGTALLSWNIDISGVSPNITHYVLYRSAVAPGQYRSSANIEKTFRIDKSLASFQDDDISPDATYQYQLVVCRGSEVLGKSNAVSVEVSLR